VQRRIRGCRRVGVARDCRHTDAGIGATVVWACVVRFRREHREAAALADSTVRGVVLQASVGRFATTGALEFHRLQDRLGQLDHPTRSG